MIKRIPMNTNAADRMKLARWQGIRAACLQAALTASEYAGDMAEGSPPNLQDEAVARLVMMDQQMKSAQLLEIRKLLDLSEDAAHEDVVHELEVWRRALRR